jgi:hypothetical protein
MLRRDILSPYFCMAVCKYFQAMLEQTKMVLNDVYLIVPGSIQPSKSLELGGTRS